LRAYFTNRLQGRVTMGLSPEEKTTLKKIARAAIEEALFGRKGEAVEVPESLKRKGGAFVTLKRRGELRGCIGYTEAVMPLWETVKQVAVQSAFHDPRFPGIEEREWADIDMEISVLTPFVRISSIEEIEVGRHGLYMEKGRHSGLLLPQVATEQGWDRTTFLRYTCWKAGLPEDVWKSKDTAIYIFSAEVF
jgi:AmmeMemoRadiSam system protein A